MKSEITAMTYFEFREFRDAIEDIITNEEERRFNLTLSDLSTD